MMRHLIDTIHGAYDCREVIIGQVVGKCLTEPSRSATFSSIRSSLVSILSNSLSSTATRVSKSGWWCSGSDRSTGVSGIRKDTPRSRLSGPRMPLRL